MKKFLKLLIISAMMVLSIGCITTTASAASTSVKAMKKGTTSTIKKTSKVTSSKKKIASAKKKSSTKYTITAKKAGKSTLKVYDKNGKLSQKIYLLVYTNKTMNYNTTAISMTKGNTKKITATVPSGCTVKYSSSNKNIAKVNKNGKITAVAKGTATIKAQIYYKNTKVKTFKKSVTVTNSTSSTNKSSSSSSSSSSKNTTSSSSSTSSKSSSNTASSNSSSSSGSSSNSSSSNSSSSSSSNSSSSSSSSTSSFKYHTDSSSEEIPGGKTTTIAAYCEKTSDVVTFNFSNDCVEVGDITTGTCHDSYNDTTAYYTSIAFTGRKAGTCNLSVYINGSLFETIPIIVTSTDDDYYEYEAWLANLEAELWDDSMTNLEKIDAIVYYIRCNFKYSANNSNKYSFSKGYEGGNCIACASLIMDVAQDLGLDAQYVYYDGYVGGHTMTQVYIDGKWYEVVIF